MSLDPFARKSQKENKKWTYLQANFSILIADETIITAPLNSCSQIVAAQAKIKFKNIWNISRGY